MAAAVSNRDTKQRQGRNRNFPAASGALIFAGTIAVLNSSGFLTRGTTATGLKSVGVAPRKVDNSAGGNGAINGDVEKGCFGPFANSASTDQITLADVGSDCYIVDDQTVAKTSGTNTRSVAGKVYDVDAAGVWVDFTL